MAAGEDVWRERAETAEAQITTAKEATENVRAKMRSFSETFGIKGTMSGDLRINFDKLVEVIGVEQALELRKIIDEKYHIRGAPGEKPKITVPLTT